MVATACTALYDLDGLKWPGSLWSTNAGLPAQYGVDDDVQRPLAAKMVWIRRSFVDGNFGSSSFGLTASTVTAMSPRHRHRAWWPRSNLDGQHDDWLLSWQPGRQRHCKIRCLFDLDPLLSPSSVLKSAWIPIRHGLDATDVLDGRSVIVATAMWPVLADVRAERCSCVLHVVLSACLDGALVCGTSAAPAAHSNGPFGVLNSSESDSNDSECCVVCGIDVSSYVPSLALFASLHDVLLRGGVDAAGFNGQFNGLNASRSDASDSKCCGVRWSDTSSCVPSLALSASVKLADLITSAAAGHVIADLHIVIIGCFTGGEMPCMVLAHDELPALMAADSELHKIKIKIKRIQVWL